ncbi:hypothetical protein [Thalassoglobus sp.]|uniref:hypothetical protein n=1 Tax=Thalassoglobus sp. TaxID=2795869 RepID=UPI003AA94721
MEHALVDYQSINEEKMVAMQAKSLTGATFPPKPYSGSKLQFFTNLRQPPLGSLLPAPPTHSIKDPCNQE